MLKLWRNDIAGGVWGGVGQMKLYSRATVCKIVQRLLSVIVCTRKTLCSGGVCKACCKLLFLTRDCLCEKAQKLCKTVQRLLSMIVCTRNTLCSGGVCKACCKLLFLTRDCLCEKGQKLCKMVQRLLSMIVGT